MKVNKLSTKKKGSKTNHKGALIVEQQKNSKWETGAAAAVVEEIEAVTGIPAVVVTGGKEASLLTSMSDLRIMIHHTRI